MSVRPLVGELFEKVTLRVSNGNLNLYHSSDSCDSCDNCDSCDSSNSRDSSNSNDSSDKKIVSHFYFVLFHLFVTKKKVTIRQNSNYEKLKPKLWQNSKNQIVTIVTVVTVVTVGTVVTVVTVVTKKLCHISYFVLFNLFVKKKVTIRQNSNYEKLKPKLWQNSKNQIVTKLKWSNCDKSKKIKLWQN